MDIDLENKALSDLTGIEYFTELFIVNDINKFT